MPGTSTKFRIQDAGRACAVLACTGGLSWEDRDVLAGQVEQHLREKPEVRHVVLDLNAVPFVNSAGLGALFQLLSRVRQRGGRLAFANVSPVVARMFDAVGLNRLASVSPDVPAAVAELNATSFARGPEAAALPAGGAP